MRQNELFAFGWVALKLYVYEDQGRMLALLSPHDRLLTTSN
jgi:hypothetical protein